MNLIKRIAGILALSLVATQMLGVGAALASSSTDECDFGGDDLEITLGNGSNYLWIEDDKLVCDADDTGQESVALKSIKSITVEMDDEEDSDGTLTIGLNEGYFDSNYLNTATDWPKFDTFDMNVTTRVILDGSYLDDTAGNSLRITVGPKAVSFSGTTATSSAPSYEIYGSDLRDTIDGSTATAKLEIYGYDGNDLIKGGLARDELYGDDDLDTIYGGPGNDDIDCDADGNLYSTPARLEYGWGQAGDDYITGCSVTAPGTGDDVFDGDGGSVALTYTDVTAGAEFSLDSAGDLTTSGSVGDDTWDGSTVLSLSGTQGDDVMVNEYFRGTLKGLGGDDVIRTFAEKAYGGAGNDLLAAFQGSGYENLFYGEGGNDVLRGKDESDSLYGGGGQDQGWGGSGGDDLCKTEVTNRCELYGKK